MNLSKFLKDGLSPVRLIFFTSLIVLAFLTVFSYSENLKLIENAGWVNHTNVVKFEFQKAQSEIKDAETGVRAYYVTGIKYYLGSYYESLNNVPVTFHNLDSLTQDNPKQASNMKKLRDLWDQKSAFLQTLTDSAGGKNKGALVVIRSGMDELNAHISMMMSEEDRLLRRRSESLNNSVSFAPAINVIVAGFAILLMIFSYLKIINELEKSALLQQKLRESNEVLEKSNSELAQFAYVASHDLQEPLRKIQTFISRIDETEKSLTDKGRDYFARVDGSAKRMQQLIRDILSYSRVDNRDNKFERTDLAKTVEVAKEQMEEYIKEHHAVVNVGKLPVLNIVRYQFEQLFQNLLSNALKFAQPDQTSVVNITADTVSGGIIHHPAARAASRYHRITVADNGIGFEQQYGERIFKIFHRLNAKEAYDGNGIGLSIVKKIMEAHNGFITAEGLPGKGAKFCLYLPV